MAKIKTAQELKEEANKFMENAKKQHALMLRRATEVESKKYIELGKQCVGFLNGEITEVDLRSFALLAGIVKNSKKSENIRGDINE